MAVSWHGATIDGNCVPDATLKVVAAEKRNRILHFKCTSNTPKRGEKPFAYSLFVPLWLHNMPATIHRSIIKKFKNPFFCFDA